MKLWKATYEIEVYIASETQPSTHDAADCLCDEMRNNPPLYEHVTEVKQLRYIDDDWLNGIPYGDAEGKTVAEIMAERVKK